MRPGYSLRFAFLPWGEDPDSMVRHQGIEALEDALRAAEPLSEVLWRLAVAVARGIPPQINGRDKRFHRGSPRKDTAALLLKLGAIPLASPTTGRSEVVSANPTQ